VSESVSINNLTPSLPQANLPAQTPGAPEGHFREILQEFVATAAPVSQTLQQLPQPLKQPSLLAGPSDLLSLAQLPTLQQPTETIESFAGAPSQTIFLNEKGIQPTFSSTNPVGQSSQNKNVMLAVESMQPIPALPKSGLVDTTLNQLVRANGEACQVHTVEPTESSQKLPGETVSLKPGKATEAERVQATETSVVQPNPERAQLANLPKPEKQTRPAPKTAPSKSTKESKQVETPIHSSGPGEEQSPIFPWENQEPSPTGETLTNLLPPDPQTSSFPEGEVPALPLPNGRQSSQVEDNILLQTASSQAVVPSKGSKQPPRAIKAEGGQPEMTPGTRVQMPLQTSPTAKQGPVALEHRSVVASKTLTGQEPNRPLLPADLAPEHLGSPDEFEAKSPKAQIEPSSLPETPWAATPAASPKSPPAQSMPSARPESLEGTTPIPAEKPAQGGLTPDTRPPAPKKAQPSQVVSPSNQELAASIPGTPSLGQELALAIAGTPDNQKLTPAIPGKTPTVSTSPESQQDLAAGMQGTRPSSQEAHLASPKIVPENQELTPLNKLPEKDPTAAASPTAGPRKGLSEAPKLPAPAAVGNSATEIAQIDFDPTLVPVVENLILPYPLQVGQVIRTSAQQLQAILAQLDPRAPQLDAPPTEVRPVVTSENFPSEDLPDSNALSLSRLDLPVPEARPGQSANFEDRRGEHSPPEQPLEGHLSTTHEGYSGNEPVPPSDHQPAPKTSLLQSESRHDPDLNPLPSPKDSTNENASLQAFRQKLDIKKWVQSPRNLEMKLHSQELGDLTARLEPAASGQWEVHMEVRDKQVEHKLTLEMERLIKTPESKIENFTTTLSGQSQRQSSHQHSSENSHNPSRKSKVRPINSQEQPPRNSVEATAGAINLTV
jgi:hypothetical protein